MGENSKIEWTHHTFNPWRGCTKVSPGCAHCYAEVLSHRNPKALGQWGPDGTRVIASEAYWKQPLKWNAEAHAAGERRRVFCASLADVFEERKEVIEPRMRLFQLIGQTPWLDWLLLTKRPAVAIDNWPLWCGYWCSSHHESAAVRRVADTFEIPNVWVGASVEDQKRADERVPDLLKIPAVVRFLSVEPLLGPINLEECAGYTLGGDESNPGYLNAFNGLCRHPATAKFGLKSGSAAGIGWVIVGGESGGSARPMLAQWATSIRDQCARAGAAFFFKQWGEWAPADVIRLTQRDYDPENLVEVGRIGKKAAGRLLDGREWNEIPALTAAEDRR